MDSVLLSVTKICKSYGERRALNDVSFQVKRGQAVGLIGPNGAGKSTTVKVICGLLNPDSGSVLMDGQHLHDGHNKAKLRIGVVPQEIALFDELSALENLKLFGALYGLKGGHLKKRCEQVLALVNLSDRARDKPSTFSGGMKRRLNIAAALLHDPALLILDEPTVGVDPQSRNAIFESLQVLRKQGHSLIYTSHYMEEVERLADHIIIIDHGRVIADETPASLYKRLPGQAALHIDLAQPMPLNLQTELKTQAGVIHVYAHQHNLEITLREHEQALPVLNWLRENGHNPIHFSTAKANLENTFLTLTGRNLRD
jgi:ABC-2 type transport system ATP-binding protein